MKVKDKASFLFSRKQTVPKQEILKNKIVKSWNL